MGPGVRAEATTVVIGREDRRRLWVQQRGQGGPLHSQPLRRLVSLPRGVADVHSKDSGLSRTCCTMFSITLFNEPKKNGIHFITISIKIAKVLQSLVRKGSKLQFTSELTPLWHLIFCPYRLVRDYSFGIIMNPKTIA